MDLINSPLTLPASLGLAGVVHPTSASSDDSRNRSPCSDRFSSPAPSSGILLPLYHLLRPRLRLLSSASSNDSHGPTVADDPDTDTERPDHAYRKQVLRIRIEQAESYNDWLSAATELDALEGNNTWKSQEHSAEFDVDLLKSRLKELDDTRLGQNQGRILLLVRTALTRNLGGMGDRTLYKHCRVGTKTLIERYIESVLETIDALVDLSKAPQASMDQQLVLRELLMTRQAFGRSALLLSGGGAFGMNHIGVVKCLLDAKLLPRIVSGASAGSIVCAVLCTKADAEIPIILKDFCYGDLEVFEKEGEPISLVSKAFRFLTKGSLFDISNLVRVIKDLLGDLTFQEAYNRTRRILNICVSTASLHELPRLLNYITAPNVMIWSAVAASCSVPFIFSAAQLYAKDPRTGEEMPWNQSPQKWIDGSVDNDLPMTRLAEMFNVNHFIVSQVNPHVVPFLERHEEAEAITEPRQRASAGFASCPEWVHKLTGLAKSEAMHRMEVLQEVGFLPNVISKLQSVLGQRYSGDITILPKISLANIPRVLSNPSTDFMLQAMLSGERATWPKLAEIRNHCAIELALDDAVHRMITNVAFSPSQVDLRRLTVRDKSSTLTLPRIGLTSHGNRNRHSRSQGTSVDLTPLKIQTGPKKVVFGIKSTRSTERPSPKVAGSALEDDDSSTACTDSMDENTDSDDDLDSDDVSVSSEDFASSRLSGSKLWPSTRQIMPFVSQPTTPCTVVRKPLSYTNISGLGMPRSAVSANATPVGQQQRTSSPERTYKMLFHGVQSANGKTLSPQTMSLGREAGRKVLDMDISGTKGMLRRRKRSQSTGLRSSKAPKPR